MSKYIPKVGEAFEWCYENTIKWSKANPVILVTDKEVAYKADNGHLVVVSHLCQFRAIPTKADVEREKLIETISKYHFSCIGRANEIQNAGFTIPKKVKRSEIHHLIWDSKLNGSEKDALELIKQVCELLGDLVKNDQ